MNHAMCAGVGCEMVPLPMQLISLPHDSVNRTYLLSPPGAAPDDAPLMIFLHGTGGTAAWADEETGWSKSAHMHGFVMAIPEGLPLDRSKPAKFLTNPQRWNDGSTQPGDWLHCTSDDVGFLTAMIEDIRNRRKISAVYLSGFSNGAGMVFRFAAERSQLVSAVAPVAGHWWTESRPTIEVPTLYMIGIMDPLIPLLGGSVRLPWSGVRVDRPSVAATLNRWSIANGWDAMISAQQLCEKRQIEFVEGNFVVHSFDGLGHHWPGGKGQLGEKLGGAFRSEFLANEVILKFCRSFTRNELGKIS